MDNVTEFVDGATALQGAKKNKNRVYRKWYQRTDPGVSLDFNPKFTFDADTKFFTIGSCFARNIEHELRKRELPLLSWAKKLPPEHFVLEGKESRSGYQNVFTPGAILEASRLITRKDSNHSIVGENDVYFDLLTPALKGLPHDIATSNREHLLSIYRNMPKADVLVLTLGYNEAWYYLPDQSWVNKAPASGFLRKNISDFKFNILNYSSVSALLEEAIKNFRQQSKDLKVVLTVSPVPLGTTLSTDHVVVANQRSKATLHAVAMALRKKYDFVDYFPSYEIISSQDKQDVFEGDGTHVKSEAVSKVMELFFDKMFKN